LIDTNMADTNTWLLKLAERLEAKESPKSLGLSRGRRTSWWVHDLRQGEAKRLAEIIRAALDLEAREELVQRLLPEQGP
jgi:hypothetical protein